jgi:uncharacterized protein (TIGR00730 family)
VRAARSAGRSIAFSLLRLPFARPRRALDRRHEPEPKSEPKHEHAPELVRCANAAVEPTRFVRHTARVPTPLRRVCVFCGSSEGRRPSYRRAAEEFGGLLAGRGIGLVFGGGRVGLMGAIADAVMAARGEAIGVIPRTLVEREVGHNGLSKLHVVETMHERKALMANLADAFVALPGGFGTYEEFCEVLTWGQLGLHGKPCGLLNVDGYYDALLALFDHAVDEKFVQPVNRAMVLADTDPARLLDRLEAYDAPRVPRWIGSEQT